MSTSDILSSDAVAVVSSRALLRVAAPIVALITFTLRCVTIALR